jgi:hypothetical protein
MLPNMAKLLETCPEALRPQFSALDNVYTFPNHSTIRIDGADDGNAEALRGRANHFVVIDEAGFIKDLRNLVHDIILPSFLTTDGRLVLITTPPKTAGHYCAALRAKLTLAGAFMKVRLSQNRGITPDRKARIMDEAGGPESPTYLREYECEEITDGDLAVCPEFNEEARKVLVRPVAAPDPYVARVTAMDLGWADPTGLLFGWYDFKGVALHVQDEALKPKPRIEQVAEMVKEKEHALWGDPERGGIAPYARISDVDPMVLAELSANHGLSFRPVSKLSGKEQMVNEVRTWVTQRRIFIDPRCVGLIAQLEAAIWNGNARRAFEHTPAYGHFDLVDALVYMLQALPRQHNPYPARPVGLDPERMVIMPGAFPDPNEQPFRNLFRPVNHHQARRRGLWG